VHLLGSNNKVSFWDDDPHEPELWNLMYKSETFEEGVNGTKRLKKDQINTIRTKGSKYLQ